LHAFRDVDFEAVLEGFWEGFGQPKSLIFSVFSIFFESKFWKTFWKSKKTKKCV